MQISDYFRVVGDLPDGRPTGALLAVGAQFVLTIPPDFTAPAAARRAAVAAARGRRVDPTATGAAPRRPRNSWARSGRDLVGPLAALAGSPPPFDVTVHLFSRVGDPVQHRAGPDGRDPHADPGDDDRAWRSRAKAQARHDGEPARDAGLAARGDDRKIVPIAIGSSGVDHPRRRALRVRRALLGSVTALFVASLLFIACNLTVGIMLSSLAGSQLQAMQLTFFLHAQHLLLSGFMFPVRGMPEWAQAIGSDAAADAFNRLVRGILLQGATTGPTCGSPSLWPLVVFALVVMTVAVRFYRRTLD